MQDVLPSLVEDEGYLIQEALDDIPEQSFREAVEVLMAAPPIETYQQRLDRRMAEYEAPPVRLTRQSARRMAIQISWARLSQPGPDGRKMPRALRRELMFKKGRRMFNFSDLARGLMGLEAR